MAIYRGAGGPGDATTDAANEASVASNKATEAAASAAAAAASATTASNAASSSINLVNNLVVQATTLDAGSSATASFNSGTTTISFGIPAGATGATGAAGTDGADGADGEPGLVWQGTYSSGTTYAVNDAVAYNGSSYICILESTGNAPTNATYWELLAAKGTDGAGAGSVTSVDASVPTGLSVTGVPITSSGTIAISYASGYSIPTTTKQGQWDSAYGWGDHASAGYATLTGTQTLTNKTVDNPLLTGAINEEVYNLSGGTVLDPANGTVQYIILTENTTFTESISAGESMTLMVSDGTDYTVTWPTMTWVNNAGEAPTLATTGYTVVVLWKAVTTLFGAVVGNGT